MVFVTKSRKAAFDPKIFLAKVGDGKTISKYQKDQIVFSQGEVADAVFYIASCDPAMADPSRNHRGKPCLHLPIWPESEGRSVALGHMG
jgi:hypothetical protein